jgi:hypothetical protein
MTLVGAVTVMAKKRTQPKVKSSESSQRATVLTIRGTQEWREWLERAANHCRVTSSTLVDIAVAKFVKDQGFEEPPPKR